MMHVLLRNLAMMSQFRIQTEGFWQQLSKETIFKIRFLITLFNSINLFFKFLHNTNHMETFIYCINDRSLQGFKRVERNKNTSGFENTCQWLKFYHRGITVFIKCLTFILCCFPNPSKSHEIEIFVMLFKKYYILTSLTEI